jgi:hypothetical protein
MELVWKQVLTAGKVLESSNVYRAAVPGGWLVYVVGMGGETSGLTFVPDPAHTWDAKTN